jgi:beta-galactosidase
VPNAPSPTLPMLFLGNQKTWELPELTALNSLPAHALVVPYPTPAAAMDEGTPSPWLQSLNGMWDFQLLPRPEAATGGVLAAEGWTPITVPGN